MLKILVVNGPNLNMLGKRDVNQYGKLTLEQINDQLNKLARKENVELSFFQSNHEGEIIDFLQKETHESHGILINPGALTHYGYSLRDALADTNLPIVEVHLSDIANREEFRKVDVLKGIKFAKIMGLKEESYFVGFKKLIDYIKKHES